MENERLELRTVNRPLEGSNLHSSLIFFGELGYDGIILNEDTANKVSSEVTRKGEKWRSPDVDHR